MSGVYVIVDDTDQGIAYSPNEFGAWGTTDGSSYDFQKTLHQTYYPYSTFSYNFQGTSIFVFSKIIANWHDTPLNFSLDGTGAGFFHIDIASTDLVHYSVFNSSTLDDEAHTLQLGIFDPDVAFNGTSGPAFNFHFDYLIYEATMNSTISNPQESQIFVDDASPYLTYSEDWESGTPPAVLNEMWTETDATFNNSLMGATVSGATVSLSFIGDSISVFGLVVKPSSIPVANYTLDGGKTFYTVQMPDIEDSGPTFNWKFLVASRPSGLQTITITALAANAFYLDYVLIQSSTAYLPEKVVIGAPQTSSTSVTRPPGGTSTPSTHRQVLGGATIAGVVVGIAIGVALCIALVLLVRKRKKARDDSASQTPKEFPFIDTSIPEAGVSPFTQVEGSTTTRLTQKSVNPVSPELPLSSTDSSRPNPNLTNSDRSPGHAEEEFHRRQSEVSGIQEENIARNLLSMLTALATHQPPAYTTND